MANNKVKSYHFVIILRNILRLHFRLLQDQLRCNPATSELGVELFYYILSLVNEETSLFLPISSLFSTCLDQLGQVILMEIA